MIQCGSYSVLTLQYLVTVSMKIIQDIHSVVDFFVISDCVISPLCKNFYCVSHTGIYAIFYTHLVKVNLIFLNLKNTNLP